MSCWPPAAKPLGSVAVFEPRPHSPERQQPMIIYSEGTRAWPFLSEAGLFECSRAPNRAGQDFFGAVPLWVSPCLLLLLLSFPPSESSSSINVLHSWLYPSVCFLEELNWHNLWESLCWTTETATAATTTTNVCGFQLLAGRRENGLSIERAIDGLSRTFVPKSMTWAGSESVGKRGPCGLCVLIDLVPFLYRV